MFDWFFNSYEKAYSKIVPTLPQKVLLSIGVFMVLYGICFTAYDVDFDLPILDNLHVFLTAIVSIAGLRIIFNSNRTILGVTVLFAFSLGLFRTLFYFIGFWNSFPGSPSSPAVLLDYIVNLYYLVMTVLGFLLFITAAAIAMGFEFRRNSLMTSCIIAIVGDVLALIMDLVYSTYTAETPYRVVLYSVELLLFLQVLWIFDSDPVRNNSTWGKHSWFMYNVRNSYISDKAGFVSPVIAAEVADPEMNAWRHPMDCGPVEKEYQFYINGRGDNHNEIMLQKWKGDDRIHVTACGNLYPSLLFANRQIVDSIFIHDGRLFLSGKDGMNVSFEIRDRRPQDAFGMDGDVHE